MTLKQWADKWGIQPSPHGGAAVVTLHPKERSYSELWGLQDYVVSSVTGGSIWLVPRY